MSLLPAPYPGSGNIYVENYEDPDRSCTWIFYNSFEFSSVDVGESGYNYSLGEAQETCVKLGTNKCNAVVGDASHCTNGPCGGPRWRPSFIVGEPVENAGIEFKNIL